MLSPSLNFVTGRELRYAVPFGNQPSQIVDALADDSEAARTEAGSDGVPKVSMVFGVPSPGYPMVKFRMIDPGVVLEKLVAAFPDADAPHYPGSKAPRVRAAPSSQLGPPESCRHTSAPAAP